jgi:septal ring factor EnvC (AmiA/AmiB activator)
MNKNLIIALNAIEKHDLELSLVTDLQGYSKKMSTAINEVKSFVQSSSVTNQELESLVKILNTELPKVLTSLKMSNDRQKSLSDKYKGLTQTVYALQNKAIAQAKELGIDVNTIPNYKELDNLLGTPYSQQVGNIENRSYFMKDIDSKLSQLKSLVSKI